MLPCAQQPAGAARRGSVVVAGRSVSYRSAGSGPRAVVVGPVGQSTRQSVGLIAALAPSCNVLAIDPAGFGLSDLPARPHGSDVALADLADHVDGALRALTVGDAALVGRGTGGLVAVELARRSPDRFPLLVLDDVPVLPAADRLRYAQEYGTPIAPELDGRHLLQHWYRRRAELTRGLWLTGGQRRDLDLTGDAVEVLLHHPVLDQLQAGAYHAAPYRAAFAGDVQPALDDLQVPTTTLTPSQPGLGRPVAGRAATREIEVGPGPAARQQEIVRLLQAWSATSSRGTSGSGAEPLPGGSDRGVWAVEFPCTPRGQLAARRHRPVRPGRPRPLVVLHASPLSSEAMLPFAQPFLAEREVVLIDTYGNGDSDQPEPGRDLTMSELAAVTLAAVEDLGIGSFDLYGTHTGALLALEAALAAPERVRSLVLDGVPLYTPQEAAEVWDGYDVDLTPRWDGGHLLAAWSNALDVLTWYPWHRRDPGHRRALALPAAEVLHRRFVQMAKGGTGCVVPHHAVARHPTRHRLPGLAVRTALCRHLDDPLAGTWEECVRLLPAAETLDLSGDAARDAGQIGTWLDAHPDA